MNTQLVRQLLAQRTGRGPWVVLETNAFGVVDAEQKAHVRGHTKDPNDAEALVELLNGAAQMIENQEWLDQVPSPNGNTRVQRTAESVIRDLRTLRDALREALQRWPEDDPRRVQLQQLCGG